MIEIDLLFLIFLAKKFLCLGCATKMLLKWGGKSFHQRVLKGCGGTWCGIWGIKEVFKVATKAKSPSYLTLGDPWVWWKKQKKHKISVFWRSSNQNSGVVVEYFSKILFSGKPQGVTSLFLRETFWFFSPEKKYHFFPLPRKKKCRNFCFPPKVGEFGRKNSLMVTPQVL